MNRLLVLSFVLASLLACSSGTDSVDDEPDLPTLVLNTGKLRSVDGGQLHIAYTYDTQGKVIAFEQHDSSGLYVRKCLADYLYEDGRIFIRYHEFEELSNGKHNPDYQDVVRHDTLFVVGNKADSCAGAIEKGTCFFYKFGYDDQGRLISIKDDNIMRNSKGKLQEKAWYTERILLTWENGNITKRTAVMSNRRDTVEWHYAYSPLIGSLVVSEPRNFLEDFTPLISEGYFGVSCKNLLQRIEVSGNVWQNEYELDASQLVKTVKTTVTNRDDRGMLEYNIHWNN